MTVVMRQLVAIPLPMGLEVSAYLDSERPGWTGPEAWRWREGRWLDVGCRIPLTRAGVRVVIDGLPAD
jgi:hypothetical protein